MTKKKGTIPVPAKKTMNFIHRKSSFALRKMIPVLIVVLIFGAMFTKFGILDPLNRKTAAYMELGRKQEALSTLNTRLTGYRELEQQYGRYSYGWMNEQEVNLVSRMDVLALVEEKIAPFAVMENLAVNSNVLTMNIRGITLEQASTMVKNLEESPLVIRATVYSAVADTADEARIFLSILLTKEVA